VSTYLEVYGHPYALKLREEADQASERAAEEAKREPSETTQTLEGSSSDVGNDELNPEMAKHQPAWYRERRRVRPALDRHQRRKPAAGAIRRTGTNLTSEWRMAPPIDLNRLRVDKSLSSQDNLAPACSLSWRTMLVNILNSSAALSVQPSDESEVRNAG
jgi:hypothetical protein